MQNSQWVFGTNAGIRFTPTPAPFANLPINAPEGCASIATANGQLRLYSDGVTIRDAADTVRLTGLSGNLSSTQAALVVPDPANKRRFMSSPPMALRAATSMSTASGSTPPPGPRHRCRR